jgi:hypothetical protein
MSYQRYVKGIIYTTVLAWTVVLYIDHAAVTSALLRPLSTVTSAVLCLVIAFDLWLWKLPVFRGWLVKRPVIEGTWAIEMVSDWIDPATGLAIGPIKGFMVVRQTLSTLSMRQLTAESSSTLVGTEFVCAPDGMFCISGVYLNGPSFAFRGKSPIHYGAIWLQVATDDPDKKMHGHYWTDRKTAGSMNLTSRRQQKYQTFAAAEAGFAAP